MTTRKQMGEFIRNQRMQQNLTQKDLAKKMKITRRQAIIEVEKDSCDYGIELLMNILLALGLELTVQPIHSTITFLNFKNVETAKQEDDPDFEKPKKHRKLAK